MSDSRECKRRPSEDFDKMDGTGDLLRLSYSFYLESVPEFWLRLTLSPSLSIKTDGSVVAYTWQYSLVYGCDVT